MYLDTAAKTAEQSEQNILPLISLILVSSSGGSLKTEIRPKIKKKTEKIKKVYLMNMSFS